MKRRIAISVMLLLCSAAAQTLNFKTAPVQDAATTVAWTNATALNTVSKVTATNRSTISVYYSPTGTVSGGVISFQRSQDDSVYTPVYCVGTDATNNGTQFTLSSSVQEWTCPVGGATKFQVKLTTVVSGTGTANISITPSANSPSAAAAVIAASALPSGAATETTLAAMSAKLPSALDGSGFLKVHEQGTATVSGTVAVSTINGVSPAYGSGVRGASVQRVTVATDDIVPVTPSGSFTVQPGNTPNTTPWLVTQTPATSGGLSVATGSIGATATSVKASAGQVFGWFIYNPNASVVYVQFFNTASGSVTLGTTTPVYSLGIPASGAANVEFSNGIAHSTAITIAVTTTRAGSTAPGSTVDYNVFYK